MQQPYDLIDKSGERKYLTLEEQRRFLIQVDQLTDDDALLKTLAMVILLTGCRVSEALELTTAHIDFAEYRIVIRCLKRRNPHVYRRVPVDEELLGLLNNVHGIFTAQERGECFKLWSYHRSTAYRKIARLMERANIRGTRATPRGLRHSFGARHNLKRLPLKLAKKWMGHKKVENTLVYTDLEGDEERQFAQDIGLRLLRSS